MWSSGSRSRFRDLSRAPRQRKPPKDRRMPDVAFTVDGKKLTAPAGMLLIDACRKAGIEIPAFCYYPGLSLQAACRMCVVRQEKVPKLQTACTTTVAEGQV